MKHVHCQSYIYVQSNSNTTSTTIITLPSIFIQCLKQFNNAFIKILMQFFEVLFADHYLTELQKRTVISIHDGNYYELLK